MSDKKIVDDYYSQAKETLSSNSNVDKKPKIQIKGKIKVKKDHSSVVFLNDHKNQEIFSQSDNKQEKQEKKVVKNILEHVKTKEEKVLKNDTIEISTTQRKEYSVQKGIDNGQNKKDNKQEDKKSFFNKRQNTYDNKYQKSDDDNKKQLIGFKKDGGYNTGLSSSSGDNSLDVGKFRILEHNKYSKSIGNKTIKTFGDKKDDEIGKKLFKKDKSNKYSKNILINEDDFSFLRSNKIKHIKKEEKKVEDIIQNLTNRSGETVIVPDILSIKELSEKIGVQLVKLITEFLKNGMKVTINSKIDFDTAAIVSEAFNVKLQKDISSGFHVEDMLSGDISALLVEEDRSLLIPRPPVISIMGHVDHGKTSLLDYLRKTKVADKEAGGITQSIGAYQVEYNGEKITFLDTPGHEAFTIMRSRGAKSTDIAILVVAADEGVKPQTIESINHAIEAKLKIIVAITKIDKEGANIDNVKSGLSAQGLLPEDWGGDIPMVGVSSKTGAGIDDLLGIILLVAEMEELKANPNRPAVGTILESHLDMKLGPVSTILINTGTLRKGDSIVCKGSYGKVKVMKDCHLKNISEAKPSTPVLVVGLDSVSDGGDIVQVVSDIEKARIKSLEYKELIASKKSLSSSSIDLIMSKIKSGNLKQLKVVVKTDTNGSLEVIKGALLKLSTPEIRIVIIHSGVGNITEGDILMCQGSSALLIGFNVELLGNTKNIIEDTKIEYISSKIIYHITERVEKIVTGMLNPKEVEIKLGEAVIAGIFYQDEGVMILGLKIKTGSKIEKLANVKIIRKSKYIGNGKIENLKSGIVDVNYLEGPIKCGIKLKTDVKVEIDDTLEIYKIEIQK